MAETQTRRRLSSATIALIVAALLAAAAIAIALFRSDEELPVTGPHAGAVEGQQAGSLDEVIARLEARLQENPDDAEGWRMLGWSYFEVARNAPSDEGFRAAMARAATAYRRAAELEPGNAENWSSLGEALQVATTDASPEARAAFERALAIDPDDPRARYFLAVQKDLQGQHEEAVEDWLALLGDTPAGAPWEADLRRTIAQVAQEHDIDLAGRMPEPTAPTGATAAIPGPTREQMEAAKGIPPGQQDEMVRGMVDRLASRLEQNPRDADGWIRLMRSRMVLNQPDAAQAALRSGLAAFENDAATQARLRDAARQLGVPAG